MTSANQEVNAEREAYIQSRMNEFKRRETLLQGRKVEFLNESNKEWWDKCQFYTLIAVFALFMVAAITFSIVAGLGLMI